MNISALGDTMVSVPLKMIDVWTRVTKYFISGSLVRKHSIIMVRIVSTVLALVQLLIVWRVPVVTQPIPVAARTGSAMIHP